MALGGVDTGRASATDADSAAATDGMMGLTPAAAAIEMTMGTAMFVAAVFDIVSDRMTVNRAAANVRVTSSLVGTSPVMPSPTTRARPVDAARPPRASPPPNSRMVPQSICAACFHVMVVGLGPADGQQEEERHPGEGRHRLGHAREHRSRHRMVGAEHQGEQGRAPPTGRR